MICLQILIITQRRRRSFSYCLNRHICCYYFCLPYACCSVCVCVCFSLLLSSFFFSLSFFRTLTALPFRIRDCLFSFLFFSSSFFSASLSLNLLSTFSLYFLLLFSSIFPLLPYLPTKNASSDVVGTFLVRRTSVLQCFTVKFSRDIAFSTHD